MQAFSFADSKLGYFTAAKGALVVRVKSCRTTPHHGAFTSHNVLVAAAAGDSDVKTGNCIHIADETGNFTLVQRRSASDGIHCVNAMLLHELRTISQSCKQWSKLYLNKSRISQNETY